MGETGDEQSQSMLIIFFDIKGIVHKEHSSWQVKQSILHATAMFYTECGKLTSFFELSSLKEKGS
jgi:hypothetical protein